MKTPQLKEHTQDPIVFHKDQNLYVRGNRGVQVAGVCYNCMDSKNGKTFVRVGLTPDWGQANRFLMGKRAKLEWIRHLEWQEV